MFEHEKGFFRFVFYIFGSTFVFFLGMALGSRDWDTWHPAVVTTGGVVAVFTIVLLFRLTYLAGKRKSEWR